MTHKKNKSSLINKENSTTGYEYSENNPPQKHIENKNKKANQEIDFDEFPRNELFYIDLSSKEEANRYGFYSKYEDIPDNFKAFVKIIALKDNKNPIHQYIPAEFTKPTNLMNLLNEIFPSMNEITPDIARFGIKEIIGLESQYSTLIKEGIKLTESLSQGIISLTKVSGTISKVFTIANTLGSQNQSQIAAISTVRAILGQFIPELKEPTIQDVLNKLEEVSEQFKISVSELKNELQILFSETSTNEFVSHNKHHIEGVSQSLDSYLSSYTEILKEESTTHFDIKNLIGHLHKGSNSFFNFLFKELNNSGTNISLYNLILMLVNSEYINFTALSVPNPKYDFTKIYTDNGADWNGLANIASSNGEAAIDFSYPDYFHNTTGHQSALLLKCMTKSFCNLIECFIFVSQNLLDYYVDRELDSENATFPVLSSEIKSSLIEIGARILKVIGTWEEYYKHSIQKTEQYAIRLWNNMFTQATTKAKCVQMIYKIGYPGVDGKLQADIYNRYQNSKFWKEDSTGYATYEFAIRKDHSDKNTDSSVYTNITSHQTLGHLQQALYNDWGRSGWGLAPRGRNHWTYNYIRFLNEMRSKISFMHYNKPHEAHIKTLLNYDESIEALRKLKTNIDRIFDSWFNGNKEFYPIKRMQNLDIWEFYSETNPKKFIYTQLTNISNLFEDKINTEDAGFTNNPSLVSKYLKENANTTQIGMRFVHQFGLSNHEIIWQDKSITTPTTATYLTNIPKYNLSHLKHQQSVPFCEIYIKHKNNIYLANKVDYACERCNLTGIESVGTLLKTHPHFSMNKKQINSAIQSYPSILKAIHPEMNYSAISLNFNWKPPIENVITTFDFLNVAIGIRQLFKDDKNIISFGDTAWISNEKTSALHNLLKKNNEAHLIFYLVGLPKMSFSNSITSRLRICGFQVVYAYEFDNRNDKNIVININNTVPALTNPIFLSGEGIAYECVDLNYNGSPIEVTIGKNIWMI